MRDFFRRAEGQPEGLDAWRMPGRGLFAGIEIPFDRRVSGTRFMVLSALREEFDAKNNRAPIRR